MKLKLKHSFQPVGQGLFFYGKLTHPSVKSPYRWVYDCGTRSDSSLIDSGISRIEQDGPIDLLALSHFDADHVSGVADLVARVPVNTLMLPYMPLSERLFLAFSQDLGPDDEILSFYINPVAYFARLKGERPSRILFVPRGDGGEADPPTVKVSAGVGPDDTDGPQSEWDFEVLDPTEAEKIADDFGELVQVSEGVIVQMQRSGGVARIWGLWEFLPYNDPTASPPKQSVFEQEVSAKASTLLSASAVTSARREIQDLKNTYDRHIGKSNFNRGSLFLFGAPVNPDPWAICDVRRWTSRDEVERQQSIIVFPEKSGIMLTGDGTLKSQADFRRFVKWFHVERVLRIAVLQVMHHGSKNNTCPGRASELDPGIAVFSSDPTTISPGHPHEEVLRDFISHNPKQVDSRYGLTINIRFVRDFRFGSSQRLKRYQEVLATIKQALEETKG